MAIKFNRSQTFATNGTVTAAGLHNLIDGTDIYQALITDQTNLTSVGSGDELLIADADLTASDAPRAVTVNELFEDALTISTYTNANLTNISYGTSTGTRLVSTNASITTGTIPNLTAGTTTSTAATFGTTTSTAATFGTTTSTAATITTGTIPTLVATTLISTGTGSASSPALSPSGDSDTGLFFPADNTIGLSTQGTQAIRITSAGNIAIGASTASQKLRVVGTSGTTQLQAGTTGNVVSINSFDNDTIYMTASATNSTQFAFGAASNIPLALLTNNTERLRIDSSGNVGIGTTNPSERLTISGFSNGTNTTWQGGTNFLRLFAGSGSIFSEQAIAFQEAGTDIGAKIGVKNKANGAYDIIFANRDISSLTSTLTERMRIDSNGNVGIGTTSPVNKLEIVGSFGRGAPVTKTGDFTLADTENWLIVNKGSSCTVTLPAASSWTGREFTIKVITAHAVVSASSNVVPINSATAGTSILGAAAGNWATLVSNGTNWVIMCG